MTKTVTPRDVADYWRRWAAHFGDSFAAHALCMVLAALDGETRAEMLGVGRLPEDGESSVWVSAQPMSPTMRQAVEEAKQRPPARHFEPSTLLEDGERTTCATCDDSGMVTISGHPEDGPDPCPDCWPEDGERDG